MARPPASPAPVAGDGGFQPWPAGSLWSSPPPAPPVAPRGAMAGEAEGLRLPSGAPLQVRLKTYFAFILELTGCRRLFVADAEGFVLMEKNSDPVMVAVAASFVSLLDRLHSCLESPILGSVSIDLDRGQVLELLQADTALGRYILGFVVSQPVRRELVHTLREGLVRVMSEAD